MGKTLWLTLVQLSVTTQYKQTHRGAQRWL